VLTERESERVSDRGVRRAAVDDAAAPDFAELPVEREPKLVAVVTMPTEREPERVTDRGPEIVPSASPSACPSVSPGASPSSPLPPSVSPSASPTVAPCAPPWSGSRLAWGWYLPLPPDPARHSRCRSILLSFQNVQKGRRPRDVWPRAVVVVCQQSTTTPTAAGGGGGGRVCIA